MIFEEFIGKRIDVRERYTVIKKLPSFGIMKCADKAEIAIVIEELKHSRKMKLDIYEPDGLVIDWGYGEHNDEIKYWYMDR